MKALRKQIDGFFILDKAIGVTSNRALQQIKHLFNAQKAGHTGSLDPLATGVLPICFGKATKFAQALLDSDKTYQVTAKLGVIMDSGDSTGNIIAEHPVPNFTQEQILAAIEPFKGPGKQIPSMFSALKYQGQPLYKLARKNITVERQPRDINIYKYELIDFAGDTLTCEIKCSKGTYIRTLIEDLGSALGCGAHVTALRRLQAGGFTIEQATCFESAAAQNFNDLLLPLDVMK